MTGERFPRHAAGPRYDDPPTVPIPVPRRPGPPWGRICGSVAALVLVAGVGAAGTFLMVGPRPVATAAAPVDGTTVAAPVRPAPSASAAPAPTTTVAPTPEPRLGRVWGPGQEGFGEVRPAHVFAGGDPTSILDGLRWSSWGEDTATATGTGVWTPPDLPVSDSVERPARVIASDLGTCHGTLAYQRIEWYFPTEGETAADASGFDDICDGL